MNVDRSEVIQRFCELASKVGEVKFKHKIPHDCFCKEKCYNQNYFQFDEEVLEFIEDAVKDRLKESKLW